ncbi:hypothetical protein KY092_04485 [Natronomonas gomsonensis]|uniref:hypothetical protein n=1 Tax=Natronomonas gomsonensis TaxID=1046043 RepID=UPI0020CA7430|nr:hypothetical protein [Natronomonas gomsonensis]MCY4729813.1 hypothetical protein [Natronomonas gomsonensis]
MAQDSASDDTADVQRRQLLRTLGAGTASGLALTQTGAALSKDDEEQLIAEESEQYSTVDDVIKYVDKEAGDLLELLHSYEVISGPEFQDIGIKAESVYSLFENDCDYGLCAVLLDGERGRRELIQIKKDLPDATLNIILLPDSNRRYAVYNPKDDSGERKVFEPEGSATSYGGDDSEVTASSGCVIGACCHPVDGSYSCKLHEYECCPDGDGSYTCYDLGHTDNCSTGSCTCSAICQCPDD